MATREVKVGLRADVTPYISAIRAAEQATTRWADHAVADANRAQRALAGVPGPATGRPGPAGPAPAAGSSALASAARAEEQRLAKQAEAMDTVGTAAAGMGAAIAGGLLMSAKAAIDWESAWAGVTKTVDGTTEEMAALESELRGMAKTLPIAHKEIAGVAEAAGQLGVKREDIASFTKTMVDLGVSTNLSAEEAATSIAQMTNVMGTAPDDVGRLGASLVALGNAGASTERDIMSMAARLSGAGKLVGASEAGVLAMANAMSSVGIEAELGGGSMSRTLLKIYSSVKQAGPELEKFAKTAGMSAEDFAAAFEADPMEAVTAFVAGLGRIKAEGGNVVAALGDVKIKGTQDLQVLLRLAGASDMLADSLTLGTQAWEQNTALTDEAGKRYATVASKLTVAKNNIVDLAIQIGDVLLPVISMMADGVSTGVDLFEKMPGPIREVTVVLGALGGAVLLFGGALLLTVPRIAATRAALATLAATSMWTSIATNFRLLTLLIGGPWVAAFAAAAAAIGALLLMNRKGKAPIDDLTSAIKADTGALDENTRRAIANRLAKEGALDIADRFGINLADVTAATMGNAEAQERLNAAIAAARAPHEAYIAQQQEIARSASSSAGERVRAQHEIAAAYQGDLAALDQLSGAVNSNADATKRAVAATEQETRASAAAEDQATRTASAMDDQLNRAMDRAAASARDTAGAADRLAQGVQTVAQDAAAAEKSIKDLNAALDDLFDQAFGLPRATDAFHKGLNDLVESAKAGSRSVNGFSNAAIANREAVYDLAESIGAVATEMLDAGVPADQVAAKVTAMRGSLLDAADAAGFDRAAVAKLIGVLEDVPETIRVQLGVETAQAFTAVDRIQALIDGLHGKNIPITFTSNGLIQSPGGGTYQTGGRYASGGYVAGPGGPREDAIPAWLSNGEFVVNAEATSRNRGLLEHVNATGYASGGPVGTAGPLPRTLKGVETALDRVGDKLDKLNSTLKEDRLGQVRKEARAFAADIKASFMAGADITSLPNAGGTGAQMAADLQRQLDRAKAFTDAMHQLRKMGLNKTALEQLRAGGTDAGLDAASAIINTGNVDRINTLMAGIAAQGAKLGARESTAKYAKTERDAARERREDLAERRRLLRRQAALTERTETSGGATRRTSTGRTLSSVGSGATLAPVKVKVTFDVTGTDRHLKAWIRSVVREDGDGNVQKAFGA